MKRYLPAALLALSLPACSGSVSTLPRQDGSHGAAATFHIGIPHRLHGKHKARYVSPATQAMTLMISGPTKVPSEVVGLTPASGGCSSAAASTQCAVTIPGLTPCSKAGCYVATIATYDAYDQANNSIPAGAKELSAAQSVAFTVTRGQANAIPITLGGIPVRVVIEPDSDSTLFGNAASGYGLAKCSSPAQHVNVFGVDADNNLILGAGAPVPSLASNDAADLPVTGNPVASAPNRFTLTPPALPKGKAVVQLTASVTPAADSGVSVQTAKVKVTFSSTICGVLTEFPVPTIGSNPLHIAQGPDGAAWFTEYDGNKIGRITTNGTITETTLPNTGSYPIAITNGPDGALWFTEGTRIGRITTSGAITETTIPTSNSGPEGIATGADGALWFTECAGNKIGRITTQGSITETNLPAAHSNPYVISNGPDGALWFTECRGNKIGRITTAGVITETTIPTSLSHPIGITAGPDGALWFAECLGNKIGRITTGGTMTETAVPATSGESNPFDIVTGADGSLWFANFTSGSIGRITTDGAVTQFPLPNATTVTGITAGSDGALWFAEVSANKIGRLQ